PVPVLQQASTAARPALAPGLNHSSTELNLDAAFTPNPVPILSDSDPLPVARLFDDSFGSSFVAPLTTSGSASQTSAKAGTFVDPFGENPFA
ncbi:hypothetical protein, partial [Salmonella sp. s58079]|uniref:hypothetical protein n=1 Tax=Salmonella sp. s58079 TaxID=3159700 RepID=UPI00397FF27E